MTTKSSAAVFLQGFGQPTARTDFGRRVGCAARRRASSLMCIRRSLAGDGHGKEFSRPAARGFSHMGRQSLSLRKPTMNADFSLSTPKGGEGRGEEVVFQLAPLPVWRGGRRDLSAERKASMPATLCAPSSRIFGRSSFQSAAIVPASSRRRSPRECVPPPPESASARFRRWPAPARR